MWRLWHLNILQRITGMLQNRQRRKSSLLRRKQIIETLRKLILKYGSEHVSVRRIAKEVGISEGAIYKHFKSKKEILSFLIDYIEESLISDIQNLKPGDNVLGHLEKVVRNHLSSIEQRRGISFLVIAEIISLGDKRLNRKIFGVLSQYINRIREILAKGVEAGEIGRDISLDMAAMAFFSMAQGLATIWALSDYSFSVEQRYTALWDVLCKGIEKHKF
jgi:AcrR family transcriptional regulator